MIVEVYQKTSIEIEEYWVLRGVKAGKKKEVIAEFELSKVPSGREIGQFLLNNPEVDFCSVEHNYRHLGTIKE